MLAFFPSEQYQNNWKFLRVMVQNYSWGVGCWAAHSSISMTGHECSAVVKDTKFCSKCLVTS